MPSIAARTRDADDVVEIAERQVGRDLEQHRRRPGARRNPVAHLDDARQQIVERGGALQLAQARRVGRGNVDGDVACDRRDRFDQADVVGGAVAGIPVGADVDPDDAALGRPRRQPRQHRGLALAVEAEPVDHRLIGLEPEHARPRIAGLRQRRHRADLDEAEAQAEQRVRHLGVLVEARRDADRIGKVEPEGPHRQPRIIGRRPPPRGEFQGLDGERMSIFRIERPQQRPGQAVEKANHRALRIKRERTLSAGDRVLQAKDWTERG